MKKVMFILILLHSNIICLPANTASLPPAIQPPTLSILPVYKIVRVIDGDTIVVTNGITEVTIRLIGVDTPETIHPQKPVEQYGIEASNFLKNLLKGESVYLKTTSNDKYNRTLAYAFRYPDGLFVNAEIIRQGYGYAYTVYPFEYKEQFVSLEQFAKEVQKGIWENNLPTLDIRESELDEESSLYGNDGVAIAYVSPEEEFTIYLWSGEPVGYLYEDSVYGFNGKHLGWFRNKAIYNNEGKIVVAMAERFKTKPKTPHMKGLKRLKPLKMFKKSEPPKPLFREEWSEEHAKYFFTKGKQ